MADKVFGRRGDPRRVGFFVSVASSLNLSQKKGGCCGELPCLSLLFFVLHSLPKCFNKLSSTSLCIIPNDSVFRRDKREFSSIAGVDSPYHSLQVAGSFWSW